MSRDELNILFEQYQKAFDKLDLNTITDFYADDFISAGPKGVIARNREEFAEKAEQAAAFYRSVGQKSARIISKRIMPICDRYNMVVIRWGVMFEKTDSRLIEFDISYIMYDTENGPKIILFISHEDEEEAMKKLGLRPKNA